jgi:hypothetical protein
MFSKTTSDKNQTNRADKVDSINQIAKPEEVKKLDVSPARFI